jgi:hypothetical protein
VQSFGQAAGKPWKGVPQTIPGRVQCELYDLGGEGTGYHDSDSVNHGSGHLNPVNGNYLNEFRIGEGVDISYTKTGDIDNNQYNFVNPDMNQLYVGWTVPGEWLNYTVSVKQSGLYRIGLMYTCNADAGHTDGTHPDTGHSNEGHTATGHSDGVHPDGVITLSVDGKDIAGKIQIPTTHRDADTIAWRQWHHWNKVDSIANLKLEAGSHLLTLYSISGNMNYDYLEFTLLKPQP